MREELEDKLGLKLALLKEILAQTGGALIAFSGGVDSTFLLSVAHEVLGPEAVAVTASSETYPAWEFDQAKQLAGIIGAKHLIVETRELENEAFQENPPDRCYHCKKERFSALMALASELGLESVCDGSNVDDMQDYRPGRRASQELGVRSPLMEAALSKEEIRELSRRRGLPTWDKPSFACLATRFPYGTSITAAELARVDAAEEHLRRMGFRQFRVRHHGDMARIEVERGQLASALARADEIVKHLENLGYTYITLDLKGYRTGSMNEKLDGRPKTE